MGYLNHISNLCTTNPTNRGKRKVMLLMQTVDIKVKMDCYGCERRVRNSVCSIKGVKSVEVNRKHSRVTVCGYVEPNKVLNKVKSTGKRVEFCPYVPYNLAYGQYVPQAYDKASPSGYVKNIVPPTPNTPYRLSTIFSEDNVNACTVM